MRIYVGNLNYGTTEDLLRQAFEQFGVVDEVAIITDRETGRARGFGFVTMADSESGHGAIEALNGTEFDGRRLNINEARPRPRSNDGGGFARGGDAGPRSSAGDGGGGRHAW
ncbi:MAG: RNA-binding protein [Phycisphaeraceae bacterium]